MKAFYPISKILFFSLVSLLVSTGGCKKDDDTVPSVQVNIYIYTTDSEFADLNAVGGWIYLTGGVRGIVVYRLSQDEFMAYDRNCTYQPTESTAIIEVEPSGITAIDSSCGSKFLLTDGSVLEGPAPDILKRYQTNFDGNLLRIYNWGSLVPVGFWFVRPIYRYPNIFSLFLRKFFKVNADFI